MISASRQILHSTLVEQDKHDYLQTIQTQCTARLHTLSEAKERFAEDLQKFQAMKSEMVTVDQMKQEELLRVKERVECLDMESG